MYTWDASSGTRGTLSESSRPKPSSCNLAYSRREIIRTWGAGELVSILRVLSYLDWSRGVLKRFMDNVLRNIYGEANWWRQLVERNRRQSCLVRGGVSLLITRLCRTRHVRGIVWAYGGQPGRNNQNLGEHVKKIERGSSLGKVNWSKRCGMFLV